VRVDKIDNDLAIECLVERPNKKISQQHQETNDQTAGDKYVAEYQVKWEELCLDPAPQATHFQSVPHL